MIRDGIKVMVNDLMHKRSKKKRSDFCSFSQMVCVMLLILIILNFDEDRVILQNNWIMFLN